MSYDDLKKWLQFALKVANIKTAAVVFHPFRFHDKEKVQPYVSPHFHLMVYGKITNTPEFHNVAKWVIVNKGDLQTDLFELITSVPKGLTPVVFHSAVLNYVRAQSDRDDFASMVQGSGAVWISNEAPSIFPQIHRKVSGKTKAGCFLLSIDGNPVAWTGPHGQTLDWFGG